MLLCSCFCLSLESSFPLLHMSKFYLYFKMQLKCHFPNTPHTPGRGDPDKLRTPIRKESCFIHLCIYSKNAKKSLHFSDTEYVFNEHTELDFFSPKICSLLLHSISNHFYYTFHFFFFSQLGIYCIVSPLLNCKVTESRLCFSHYLIFFHLATSTVSTQIKYLTSICWMNKWIDEEKNKSSTPKKTKSWVKYNMCLGSVLSPENIGAGK